MLVVLLFFPQVLCILVYAGKEGPHLTMTGAGLGGFTELQRLCCSSLVVKGLGVSAPSPNVQGLILQNY